MRRHRLSIGLAWLLAVPALPAAADVDLGPFLLSGWVEAGGRATTGDDGDGDSAKFDEYRDPHEGLFGAGNLLLQHEDGKHYLRFGGYDIGEEDGEYFLEGGRWGHWGISGDLSLIPHNYSNRALTPYVGGSSGRLTLLFARPTADLDADVAGSAGDARLDFDTFEGNIGAFYKPTSDLELETGYRIIDRDGRRPEQLFYGFSNFVHFAQPVDERVHEGTADVRYVQDDWSAGLNYTANFFENDYRTVVVDNPLFDPGPPPNTDRGATAAAPDNSSHLVSLSGSAVLPTPFVSRVAATVAYGLRFQDENFLPLSVNPALQGDPNLQAPQGDLDGDVRTFLGNLVLTARPTPKIGVTGRYRIYDYDSDTDEILFTAASVDDQSIAPRTFLSFAPSYTKQNASLETSYRITNQTQATVGFAWERWNRSSEREVRRQDEYNPEFRLDHRAGQWGRFRTSYGFRERNGAGYDELAPFRATLQAQGPLTPPIRKFSQADNRRHSFHFISQLYPREDTDLTFTSNFHLTEWTDGDFGLQADDQFDIGIEATHRLHPRVEIITHYNYDLTKLRMRTASSSGANVWTSDHRDRAHTGGGDVAIDVLPDRLIFTTGYFIQRAKGRTHASGVPAADAGNYAEIDNTLWAVTSSLRFRYDENLSFVARHRYENYEQEDWQFDGLGVTGGLSNVEGVPVSGANDLYLNNGLQDYDAHLFSLSAILEF